MVFDRLREGAPIGKRCAVGKMPHRDGYSATEEIRKQEAFKKYPIIIALTASHLSEHDKQIALRLGMNDFLIKPVTLDEIKRTLSKHFQQQPPTLAPPISSCPIDTCPIDLVALKELVKGDLDVLEQLLNSYLETLRSYQKALDKAFETKNIEEFIQIANSCSRTCSTMGCSFLSGVFSDMQRLAVQGKLDEIPSFLDEIDSQVKSIERNCLKQLKDLF